MRVSNGGTTDDEVVGTTQHGDYVGFDGVVSDRYRLEFRQVTCPRKAGHGEARHGPARRGKAWRRRGLARRCTARQGMARESKPRNHMVPGFCT